MTDWEMAGIIFVAGGVGGLLNALGVGRGVGEMAIELPHRQPSPADSNARAWDPGFITPVVTGALAAVASWALYGPIAGVKLGGAPPDLTWAAMLGAVLVGVAGARWIDAEIDKRVLKETAVRAANGDADPAAAADIAAAPTARKALEVARGMTAPSAADSAPGSPKAGRGTGTATPRKSEG